MITMTVSFFHPNAPLFSYVRVEIMSPVILPCSPNNTAHE